MDIVGRTPCVPLFLAVGVVGLGDVRDRIAEFGERAELTATLPRLCHRLDCHHAIIDPLGVSRHMLRVADVCCERDQAVDTRRDFLRAHPPPTGFFCEPLA